MSTEGLLVSCTEWHAYSSRDWKLKRLRPHGRSVLVWKKLLSPNGIRAFSAGLLKGVKLLSEEEGERGEKSTSHSLTNFPRAASRRVASRWSAWPVRSQTFFLNCFNGVVEGILPRNWEGERSETGARRETTKSRVCPAHGSQTGFQSSPWL